MEKEKKKKPKNYLNNADMLKQIELSHKQGKMTEEFGRMTIELCKRYAKHPKFANIYSHEEDMKAYAIMTVVKVWKSFNPEKSNNPFSYFTQILRHAFYAYGNSEKKQQDAKAAVKKDLGLNPSFMELLEMEKVSKDNFIVGFEDSSDTESDMSIFEDKNFSEDDSEVTITFPEDDAEKEIKETDEGIIETDEENS